MNVFLTGSSSYFARALLPVLCADSEITAITGVDPRPSRARHPKLKPVLLDMRSSAISQLLAGHDALVHLASVVLPASVTADEVFDINVRAAHKLFHNARSAGIARLIHVSSALVYGEAVHADEQRPLNPLGGFLYARHQAQLEELLSIELPECVRLRPQIIVGPNAHPALKCVLNQPFYPREPQPPSLHQCVHEDDVARAIVLCLKGKTSGAYNLSTDDSFTLREAIRLHRAIRAAVPPAVFAAGLKIGCRSWRCGYDPGLLEAMRHTLLVNCRRAIVELGWRSQYTAPAALRTL